MNREKLKEKVDKAMDSQTEKRGYAAPVDVLEEIGLLSRESRMIWQSGRCGYLEKVCSGNLSKLSSVLSEMQSYARAHGLKPSLTVYKCHKPPKKRGANQKSSRQYRQPGEILRFSKSGSCATEKKYQTHFVDPGFQKNKEELKSGTKEAAAECRKQAENPES